MNVIYVGSCNVHPDKNNIDGHFSQIPDIYRLDGIFS